MPRLQQLHVIIVKLLYVMRVFHSSALTNPMHQYLYIISQIREALIGEGGGGGVVNNNITIQSSYISK